MDTSWIPKWLIGAEVSNTGYKRNFQAYQDSVKIFDNKVSGLEIDLKDDTDNLDNVTTSSKQYYIPDTFLECSTATSLNWQKCRDKFVPFSKKQGSPSSVNPVSCCDMVEIFAFTSKTKIYRKMI